MAKKLIKKYLPHPEVITHNRWIKMLGPKLQEPALWHINRKSCTWGVALGVFCAFIPAPFQMVIAAFGSIAFRLNILIAVPLVWLSNPITIPPIFYFCYWVGTSMLGLPPNDFNFELSFDWLVSELLGVWRPLLLGCLVVGTISALAAFAITRLLWRKYILMHLKARQARKKINN